MNCIDVNGSIFNANPGSNLSANQQSSFEAFDLEGNPVGNISSNDDGSMWGMGSFCQNAGLEENDILVIEFDIASKKAYLSQTLLSEILDEIDL